MLQLAMHMEVYQNNMEYPSLTSPPAGSIRFNTDSSKLEIYNGEAWWNIDTTSPYEQLGGARGLLLGGYEQPEGGVVNTIQYINISSTGDAQDFGDLAAIGYGNASFSNRTRGIYLDNSPNNQYINLSSTGNSVSLGDAQGSGEYGRSAAANDIRGIYQYDNGTNTLEYFTISTDAKGQDFGDAQNAYTGKGCVGASPTRYVLGGGAASPSWNAQYTPTEFVNFMSLGNGTDFGDLTQGRAGTRSTGGNAVRGIYAGGYSPVANPSNKNSEVIDYITVATLGNSKDFGDLSEDTENPAVVTSSTRAVIAGGNNGSPTPNNVLAWMEYVEIMTTGNSVDFGDFVGDEKYGNMGGMSTGHGGLVSS